MEEEICAGGFVVRDGLVLAIQRHNGVWLAPKGHVDPGESLAQTASRELLEETGLRAQAGELLGETRYTFWEGKRLHHKRVSWFLMRAEDGEVVLEPGMFVAHRWLGPSELATFTFSHDRELARKALALAGIA